MRLFFGRPMGNSQSPVSIIYVKPSAQFKKISIPFQLMFINNNVTLEDSIKMMLKCSEPCQVSCYWGVETKLLAQIALNNCVSSIDDELLRSCMKCDETIMFKSGEHQLKIKSKILDFGPVPRKIVPLVILCSVPDQIHTPFENLLTVFHIRDQKCLDPSRKLNEMVSVLSGDSDSGLQKGNGKWLPLYKYFTENGSSLCIVCQENIVSHILLPCRHACLCSSCCDQIADKCPMCRSIVTSLANIDQ